MGFLPPQGEGQDEGRKRKVFLIIFPHPCPLPEGEGIPSDFVPTVKICVKLYYPTANSLSSLDSIFYRESDKFSHPCLPLNVHIRNPGSWRSLVAPHHKLCKFLFVSLGDQFDTAIRMITYPAGQSKLAGTAPRRRPKIHSLDSTAHDHVNPLGHSLAFLYEITIEGEGTF